LAFVFLQGCITATKEEVATANFGPLPTDYQERVKTFMTKEVIRLRPDTATFDFHGTPRKGIYQAGLVGAKKRYGWIVAVKVRVKITLACTSARNASSSSARMENWTIAPSTLASSPATSTDYR
jgi:hypothetical protein